MNPDDALKLDRAVAPSCEENRLMERVRECDRVRQHADALRASGESRSAEKLERRAERMRENASQKLTRLREGRATAEARRTMARVEIGITQEMLDAWESVIGHTPELTGRRVDWFLHQVLAEALFALQDAAGRGADGSLQGLLGWRFNVQRVDWYHGTRRREREKLAVDRALQVEAVLDQAMA